MADQKDKTAHKAGQNPPPKQDAATQTANQEAAKANGRPSAAEGAKGSNGKTPGAKKGARFEKGSIASLKKRIQKLDKRGRILAVCGVGLCVVLLAGLLVFGLMPGRTGDAPSPAASGGPAAPDEPVIEPDSLPDKLDETQYLGTVLPQSEDAGMAYCEETLFLGDSNTERMLYYDDVTGVTVDNGIGVVGMGITSFTSHRCVRFSGHSQAYTMAEAVGILQPKRVVITFGTNNVGIDLDTFTKHYLDALDAIHDEYPYADVIIGAVFPVDQYRQNTSITMQGIEKMNVVLADIASQTGNKFLNWYEAIYDEETGYSGFEYTIQDGAHLSRKGMEAIFEYFRTHAYLTEDTRPTLKTVPKRLYTQPGRVTRDPTKIAGPIDWSKYESKSEDTATGVSVTFAAYDQTNKKAGGGTVSGGGQSGASFTLTLQPGAAAPSITAEAADGYEFAGWGASHGSTSGASGKSISYSVPGDTAPGTSITVSALFREKEKDKDKPPSSSSNTASPTDAAGLALAPPPRMKPYLPY